MTAHPTHRDGNLIVLVMRILQMMVVGVPIAPAVPPTTITVPIVISTRVIYANGVVIRVVGTRTGRYMPHRYWYWRGAIRIVV